MVAKPRDYHGLSNADDVADFPEASSDAEQPSLDFSTITETKVEPVIEEVVVEDEHVNTEAPAENDQKNKLAKKKRLKLQLF